MLRKEKLPVELLNSKIVSLAEVERRDSRWGHMTAYWTGEREFAHLHNSDTLDVRITRTSLKRMSGIRLDTRVRLRTRASDWIEFKIGNPEDVEDAFKLVKLAWSNNRTMQR